MSHKISRKNQCGLFLFLGFILVTLQVHADGVDLQDMYVEVKYNDYHCLFTILDNKVFYEDMFYSLSYIPQTECGVSIIRYWQEDFIKWFSYHNNMDVFEGSKVYFRLERDGEWRIADRNETEGKLLLSLMSRIQRFPLEEQYCPERDKR